MAYAKPALGLDARLTAIVDADYPRFSAAEMERRRGLMAREMEKAGVDHLVATAAFFRGGPVHWLSDWLTTYEAALVFSPGRKDSIFVQFYNHSKDFFEEGLLIPPLKLFNALGNIGRNIGIVHGRFAAQCTHVNNLVASRP